MKDYAKFEDKISKSVNKETYELLVDFAAVALLGVILYVVCWYI